MEGASTPPPAGAAHPRDAVARAAVGAPLRGNRRLERFLSAANADDRLRAWWHMQHVLANRLGMSDHSWVHVRIVLNIALRLFRLLAKRGVQPAMVSEHLMREHDAEVVIAAACLLHDTGMSIHRSDHEAYSLFLAAERLPLLLDGIYDEPERTVVVAEALHAVIGHRRRGDPITVEAGIVRVADALDLAQGRSRVPLATKLRGSGLEDHVEVVARIEAEHEKRLVPVFRI